jgi:hypothetical protein
VNGRKDKTVTAADSEDRMRRGNGGVKNFYQKRVIFTVTTMSIPLFYPEDGGSMFL